MPKEPGTAQQKALMGGLSSLPKGVGSGGTLTLVIFTAARTRERIEKLDKASVSAYA